MRWTTGSAASLLHHITPTLHHSTPRLARLVLPRGNAPRSSAYQAGALLLSYGRKRSGAEFQRERREIRSPKSGIRKKSEGRRPKTQFVADSRLRDSALGLLSDFGRRISDLAVFSGIPR